MAHTSASATAYSAVTGERPVAWSGVAEKFAVPSPLWLPPQHQTLDVGSAMAHTSPFSTRTALAFEKPVTVVGEVTDVVVSSPVAVWPQHDTVPATALTVPMAQTRESVIETCVTAQSPLTW